MRLIAGKEALKKLKDSNTMTLHDIYIILMIVFFTVVLVTFSIVPLPIGATIIGILIGGEILAAYRKKRESTKRTPFKNHFKGEVQA